MQSSAKIRRKLIGAGLALLVLLLSGCASDSSLFSDLLNSFPDPNHDNEVDYWKSRGMSDRKAEQQATNEDWFRQTQEQAGDYSP